MSTSAGGFGLSSATNRRISAFIGSMIEVLPVVLADLTGPIGERIRDGIGKSRTVDGLRKAIRALRDDFGITHDAMSSIIPQSWINWTEGQDPLAPPSPQTLAAHDCYHQARKAQSRIGKLVQASCFDGLRVSLSQLPDENVVPQENNPCSGLESKNLALARHRSLTGPGALACFRARPVDQARMIPPQEFVFLARRVLGIESFIATSCPCCGAENADTWHARLCHRSGSQVNQHQPLVHTLAKLLKRVRVPREVEDGSPFTTDKDLRMDIVILPGGLANAPNPEYRSKGLLVEVTFTEPQASSHMNRGSSTNDGVAAGASETRKSAHYARPGNVSFDERSFKLATLAVESFGHLGDSGCKFIDQLASSIAGGIERERAMKGVCKEKLLQIISVTSQVAISRKVSRYKLALRHRQARRSRATSSDRGGIEDFGRHHEEGPSVASWGFNVDTA